MFAIQVPTVFWKLTTPSWSTKSECFFFSVFLTPPALHEIPEAWFNVRRTYTLSSLAFKRVTRRGAIKTQFPSPCYPQVHEGAIGRLEHTNNLRNLGKSTLIWSRQAHHNIDLPLHLDLPKVSVSLNCFAFRLRRIGREILAIRGLRNLHPESKRHHSLVTSRKVIQKVVRTFSKFQMRVSQTL